MGRCWVNKQEAEIVLIDYLLSHEDDIALSINDFGDLKELFIFTIHRKPVEGKS